MEASGKAGIREYSRLRNRFTLTSVAHQADDFVPPFQKSWFFVHGGKSQVVVVVGGGGVFKLCIGEMKSSRERSLDILHEDALRGVLPEGDGGGAGGDPLFHQQVLDAVLVNLDVRRLQNHHWG